MKEGEREEGGILGTQFLTRFPGEWKINWTKGTSTVIIERSQKKKRKKSFTEDRFFSSRYFSIDVRKNSPLIKKSKGTGFSNHPKKEKKKKKKKREKKIEKEN